MKKLLCLLLALLMLAPAACLAESDQAAYLEDLQTNYQYYENADATFSLYYPGGWFAMDGENANSLMQEIINSNEETRAQVEALEGQLKSLGMLVALIKDDGSQNLTVIQTNVGVEFTDELLQQMIPSVAESANESGWDILVEPQILTLGEYQTLYYIYSIEENVYGLQAYVPQGENVFIFTQTCTGFDPYIDPVTFGFVIGGCTLPQ